MDTHVCVHVHICTHTHTGVRRAPDHLELELKAVRAA